MAPKIDVDVLTMIHGLGSRALGFARKAYKGEKVVFEYDGEIWEISSTKKKNGSKKTGGRQ